MKKTILATLFALAGTFALGTTAHAADGKQEARAEAKAKWDAMTPEEKAAAKDKAKAKWDAMTPEEREAVKKKHPRAAAKMGDK